MGIKEILAGLPTEQRKALFDAFEEQTTFLVRLAGNTFIGVYLDGQPGLVIQESAGVWSIGTLERESAHAS